LEGTRPFYAASPAAASAGATVSSRESGNAGGFVIFMGFPFFVSESGDIITWFFVQRKENEPRPGI
jgi:hypothetical protein